MTVLVTGVAGFIGFHVAERLLARGEPVCGIDIVNDYYDRSLKEARVQRLAASPCFEMIRADIADAERLIDIVAARQPRLIIHLAAQAGVRYSLSNPFAYERSNLAGHLAVLEASRRAASLTHLVYASSSSVYGDRPVSGPAFREDDPALAPVSLYAATKRSGELLSESYARLHGIAQTGLRFFTVYGPWGRPDMAYFSFTRKILAGEAIEVYGEGRMARDFTYIDDIVDGVVGVAELPPPPGTNRILNIGHGRPVGLLEMIEILENSLGTRAKKLFRPMQPGDVTATFADISRIGSLTNYRPRVSIEEGLPRFVAWYREHYPLEGHGRV